LLVSVSAVYCKPCVREKLDKASLDLLLESEAIFNSLHGGTIPKSVNDCGKLGVVVASLHAQADDLFRRYSFSNSFLVSVALANQSFSKC